MVFVCLFKVTDDLELFSELFHHQGYSKQGYV